MAKKLLLIPILMGLLFVSNALIPKSSILYSSLTVNDALTHNIIMVPSATIEVDPISVCLGSEVDVTFIGSDGNPSYTFNYSINGTSQTAVSTNGNQSSVTIQYTADSKGTFEFVLESVTDSDDVTEIISGESVTITVSEPVVDFTFNNNICSGTSVQFTSNVSGDNPFMYSWNFGDGNTSSSANPSHIFTSLGCGTEIFNVTLTATDDFGCSNSITKQVSIQQQPDINFSEAGIQPWEESFDNCGSNTTNPEYMITVQIDSNSDTCISSYNINWGDGNSQSNVVFPLSHTYMQLGSFNMVITSFGDNGCTIVKEYLVKNSSNPTGAVLNPGNTVDLCLPVAPIGFSITNWGDNPPDTQYVVDFGDGTIETYLQSQLESSSYYNNTDPAASANFPIPHTYSESNCPNNFYTVVMTISTSCGQSVSSAGPIIILKKPEVDFEFDDKVCVNSTVQFINTTVDGYNQSCTTNAAFYWDFGDGTTSTDVNPTHVYSSTGNYNVSLYATNFCGSTEPVVKSICVESPLTPDFTLNNSDGCTPFAVNTTNVTNESDSCDTTYLWTVNYVQDYCSSGTGNWSFSNGTDQNSPNPSFDFIEAGSYILTLSATNSCGTFTSTPQTITVKQPPISTLNAIDDFCGPASINPIATVDNCAPNSETVTYNWSFPGGNPATSNQLDPGIINYTIAGVYQITFSVTNSCGTTIKTEDFTINPLPTITNTDLTQTICTGTSSAAVNLSSNIVGTTYTWTGSAPAGVTGFITSGNSNTIPPQIIFNSNATPSTLTYTVVPAANGCIGNPINIEIIINPSPEIINQPISDTVCLNGPTNDLNVVWQGSGTPVYQWYSNTIDSNTGGTLIPGADTNTYSPPTDTVGMTYYYLVITFSSGGCNQIVSNTASIEVVEGPQIDVQPIAQQSICVGGDAQAMSVSTTGGTGTVSYQWYTNTTSSNTGGTPITGATFDTYTPSTFTTTGTYYYYVEVSVSGNGCGSVSSAVSDIVVVDDPVIDAQPLVSQELCQGASPTDLTVSVSGGLGTISYQWYSNTANTNTGGTLIPGATGSTYTPSTGTVGTLYYYVVVTQDVSGCSVVSDTATVIVIPSPTIVDQPIGDSICLNGTTSDLTATYSNGTGTATYQWYENTVDDNTTGTPIAGATSDTFSPPTDTVGMTYYYLVITFSSGGCNQIVSNTASIEVVEGPQIDVQPIAQQSICVGGDAQAMSVSTTGGTGTVSYQWYTNTTSSNTGGTPITGATSDTYTPPTFTTTGTYYYYVEVSVSGNGCGSVSSAVSEIVVVDDPVIDTQPLAAQELCQGASPTDLTVSVSGGLGTISYQWYSNTANTNTGGTLIPGATGSTYTPATGTVGTMYYYVVVTQDVSGCSVVSQTSVLTITNAPQIDQHPLSQTICLGDPLNDLVVTYINGTGTPNYQWYVNDTPDTDTPTPVGTDSSVFSPPATVVGTFYYYVTLTFPDGGCGAIVSNIAEITINQVPVISDDTALICSGNAFEIIPDESSGDIVPSNTTYIWSIPIINPVGAVTGATGESNAQISISQNLINTTTNPATVTYTVTPTSGNCVGNTFTVTVTVNPSILVNAQVEDISCFGSNDGSITLDITGGVPFTTGAPYVINWSGPNGFTSTMENIVNLEPGDYLVTIDDFGGCPFQDTYTIVEPSELVLQGIDQQSDITCFGANDGILGITIVGGTLPYTYNWTLNSAYYANTEDISNLQPGLYQLTVTDANLCELILNPMVIEEPPLLTVTLESQTNIDCFGDATGAISVLVQGGRPNYLFSWIGPNGFTSNSQNISNLYAGDYQFTVTDTSGCIQILQVTLTQNDEINIQYTTTDIRCYGDDNASITIDTINGGVPPYQIEWSNLGSGMVQNNLSAGTYTITITDALNCLRNFDVVIDQAPIFTIDPIVTQISCYGENDASIKLNLQGGAQPITLAWDDDSSAGVERNNLGPGTYSVTIMDSSVPLPSCTIQQTFVIYDVLPLQISAVKTDALDCDVVNSGSIDLSISGGTIASNSQYQITWSNGSNNEDLIDIGPGNYYVTVKDDNGCEITGQWEVLRFDPLELQVEVDSDVNCDTREVKQTFRAVANGGVPGYTYSWSSGLISGSNNEIMETDTNGLVLVGVTDSYGCTQSFSYNVAIPVIGFPNFSTNSTAYTSYGVFSVQDPIQFINEATGDYIGVRWDFGDGTFSDEENPSHIYIQEGSYVITQMVTYPFGCEYAHVITLQIEKGYALIFPNAFTPNEDSLNDYFVPKYIGLFDMQFNIYDTWGSLIYSETGDSLQGWDGKLKDRYAENGNYYYTFTGKTFYGKILTSEGAFTYIK